ncbi:hypothetical protein WDU94_000666 [Cyamophila willieti]
MKEGLLNKILEQEIELVELRNKVSSYEAILLDKGGNHITATKKPPQLLPPPPHHSPKTALHDFTCHVIGDSHVRGLAEELSTILPSSCCAEGVFIPGVGFHGLANQHTQSPGLVIPTKEDRVVVMCGTNDVCCEDWATIQNALDTLITKFQGCKQICVVGVPMRYDNKKLNYHIKRFNLKLKHYFKIKAANSQFLDTTRFLKPKDYRMDGLHLNKIGSSKLCKRIKMVTMEKELATVSSPPAHSPCENSWLLAEPVRDDLPVPDNATIVICDDLIDLTDPPQLDADDEKSFFSRVMNNTVLFPDTTVNNSTSNAEPIICQTPYTYSTPCPINSGNRYYQLTQVSLNSFTNNASYCSPLSTTTNQTNMGFQNVDQTNSVM